MHVTVKMYSAGPIGSQNVSGSQKNQKNHEKIEKTIFFNFSNLFPYPSPTFSRAPRARNRLQSSPSAPPGPSEKAVGPGIPGQGGWAFGRLVENPKNYEKLFLNFLK